MNTVHIYVLIIHILYVCVWVAIWVCDGVFTDHRITHYKIISIWMKSVAAFKPRRETEKALITSWAFRTQMHRVLEARASPFLHAKIQPCFFFLPKTQATGYGSPVNSFSPHKNSSAPALHSNSGSAHTSVSDVSGPSLLHTQSSSKPAAYIHWHCERWVTHRKWLSAELWHTWMSDHALCCCSAARTHFYSVFKNEIIHAN